MKLSTTEKTIYIFLIVSSLMFYFFIKYSLLNEWLFELIKQDITTILKHILNAK